MNELGRSPTTTNDLFPDNRGYVVSDIAYKRYARDFDFTGIVSLCASPLTATMLTSILWILSSVTACLCSPIPEPIPANGSTDAATIEPRDRNANWWKAKEKHYLRLPVNRRVFNGTGRRRHHNGPHVENPVQRRWGWEPLEDLGGIAYIIQRSFALSTGGPGSCKC